MAKPTAPKAAAPAAPGVPAAAPLFKIETGVALPPIQRLVGAQSSPYTAYMQQLPLGTKPDGSDLASFFIPASVPASITDAGEREKAAKDEARKVSNRVSGIARRLSEQTDPNGVHYAYALRTRTEAIKQADGSAVNMVGVRVYRVQPAAVAPAAPSAPAPMTPPPQA